MINTFPTVFNVIGNGLLDVFDDKLFKDMETKLTKWNDNKTQCPLVRAYRTDKLDTFYVEMPGCKKEDITVTVADEYHLLIEGKRKIGEKEYKFETDLASDKDIAKAKVAYADGMLTVTVEPKPVVEPERKTLSIQ